MVRYGRGSSQAIHWSSRKQPEAQSKLKRALTARWSSGRVAAKVSQRRRRAHVSNMHQLVPRRAPAVQLDLPEPSSSAPPAFPGLVSALRPIRRTTLQLADEAALLRRFTYKHKNQHKGQRWWKRIVEVDRAASRAVDELKGWLGVFSLRCVVRCSSFSTGC